jgi:hypothetical protein
MSDRDVVEIPKAASLISLSIALSAAAGLSLAWWSDRSLPFALGAIGFLLVSPLWFLSPIRFRFMREPMGARASYRRKLTPFQAILSLVGYATILAALVAWCVQALFASILIQADVAPRRGLIRSSGRTTNALQHGAWWRSTKQANFPPAFVADVDALPGTNQPFRAEPASLHQAGQKLLALFASATQVGSIQASGAYKTCPDS